MTANSTLRVTETDFDTIKNNLKTYLRGQSQFQDYDFDGSGMSVLLDILAYNTHYMAYYLNMVANEAFLDTAQLRPSVISHAKSINYVPETKHGAETTININVTPTVTESATNTVVLERYTRLLGTDIDGINHPFVTIYSNTTTKVGDSFAWSNVHVKQGEVITLQYLMDATNTKRRFRLPSANVDSDSITVIVQESTSNTAISEYVYARDITELDANSKVYFFEEDTDGSYVVQFGDDVVGKKPKNGNVIIITYLDTLGSKANKIESFSFAEPVGGLFSDNVSITATSSTYGGTEKETVEEVRYRAPYAYVSQNRAVTVMDYETLLLKDYDYLDSISAWGGEDNEPPIYGKVFLSLKTKDNYFLTNEDKERIKNTLISNRNVLTVIPEIVDPSYTYLLVRGDVYYDSTVTVNTVDGLSQLIRASVLDYESQELNRFDATFKKSKLQNYIESSDNSITASDIRVLLQKRVTLTTGVNKTYIVDFNVPIKKGDFSSSLSTYPQITVADSNLIQRQVFFEEVPSIASGISEIRITNPGINYRTQPTVTIVGDGVGATAVARIAGSRIVSIDITNPGTNYSRASIIITGGDGTEGQAEAVLESRVSSLRTYYLKTTGEKIFVNNNAGTVDYDLGRVILSSLIPISVGTNTYYDENVLTINVPVEKEIISSEKNRIIDIDDTDPLSIQVNVYPET